MGPIKLRGAGPSGPPPTAVDISPGGSATIDSRPRLLKVWGRSLSVAGAVVSILALACVSVVLAATSDHVEHPTATALYYGYLVAASLLVGLYW
jgi:hypothetical protein